MTRRRAMALLGAVLAGALVASACGHDEPSAQLQVEDPGRCTAVDLAAAPEVAPLLFDAAGTFNDSAPAHFSRSACAFVRVVPIESASAVQELETGWPDRDRYGPRPVVWVPASSAWAAQLDASRGDAGLPAMTRDRTSFARTPTVIAMPAPMARTLRTARRTIRWHDIETLAATGWGARGHREWGAFRLGEANPNWSTPALSAALARRADPLAARAALQRAIPYYGESARTYTDTWARLGERRAADAMRYLSGVVTDERTVAGYDAAAANNPAMPLVALYPADTPSSDNPFVVLDAPWVSPAERAAAQAFIRFARGREVQTRVAAAGFRPAVGLVDRTVLAPRFGVDTAMTQALSAPTGPAVVDALSQWQALRKRARVMVLFDVSDSMGDPADPMFPDGPSKIDLARRALATAVDQLGTRDDVALRTFTTVGAHDTAAWSDVVPLGSVTTRRPAFERAAARLQPRAGSPLYAAVHAAVRTVADAARAEADADRIDAVVLVTDGYNEYDRDNDRRALLSYLARTPVRLFTIAYSNDADIVSLDKMAQATNARMYDARNTELIGDALVYALASL